MLFLKLSELRESFKEQGEEETMSILFEEGSSKQITNLFYQTPQMNAEFARYPEIVFINRRLIKTRFRRNLVLFCGINSEGKTIIVGVAFLKEESQECF
jgi:hypothetical protein